MFGRKIDNVRYPGAFDVRTARLIAGATQDPNNRGKLAKRTTIGMLSKFARGLTVVVEHEGKAAATASITFRGKRNGQISEEVGTVVVFPGHEGNGYGPDATRGIVRRREGRANRFFAMVQENNGGGLRSFGNMRGSRRMTEDEVERDVPKGAFVETVAGAASQKFILFDVTQVNAE